jgi:hypothetical protein
LHMPEPELIDHAGLDSTVFIRIYILGWVNVHPVFVDWFTLISRFSSDCDGNLKPLLKI